MPISRDCTVVTGWSSSASMASSISSGSLEPLAEKNLMPLSKKGLWEALITMPATAAWVRVIRATAGVGIGPSNFTLTPAATRPASRADSNI